MNLRYKILCIGEERYILDMGDSFWKIIFPILYWMLPNTAYKVDDQEMIEKIKVPGEEKQNIGWLSVLAGVIAFGSGNLLYPLVNYLNIEITSLISSTIVGIVIVITLSSFLYMNKRSQMKITKVIYLKQYSKKRLKIRLQSFKTFFFFIFGYLLFLGMTILSWGAFIQLPNAFMLFSSMVSFYLLLLCSFMTVGLGDARVKFIGDKNAEHV